VFPLNLPNALTLVRMLLVPVVVAGLLVETRSGSVIAAAVFALAAASDVLDGRLARSRKTVTTFGKVMDPVADKLLIIAALVALVSLDRLAVWIAVVITVRELAVTGLRVAAGAQGYLIPASSFGKAKTVLQVVAVFSLIAAPDPGAAWIDVLLGAAVVVTVASGVDYFLNVRRREPMPPRTGA
jgi:CDP-diacylglycerol---glycerol-3-phosphate 3-phosphatidyltransferase